MPKHKGEIVFEVIADSCLYSVASSHPHQPQAKYPTGPAIIDENTVYLEDVEGSAPQIPAKKQEQGRRESPPCG